MNIYLVGGAIRDTLLGLPVCDKDWVVVGACANDLLALNYKPVGQDFPVFLHPDTFEEYALARTERKQGHGYKGFVLDASPNVTLEQDLARRDFTMNAIAQSQSGELIDPFGGQADIQNKWIRHISPAFAEDPLRVIRAARFAARFSGMGFRIADQTLKLMQDISQSGELAYLAVERIWLEIQKVLQVPSRHHSHKPSVFFNVLKQCGALDELLPELSQICFASLDDSLKILGSSETGTLDPLTHYIIEISRLMTAQPTPINDIKAFWQRLKAPKSLINTAGIAIEILFFCSTLSQKVQHVRLCETLLTLFKQTDALRRSERFLNTLPYLPKKYQHILDMLITAHSACQTMDVKALDLSGLKGIEIKEAIQKAQLSVIELAIKPHFVATY